jgi:radical SAM superfamily enzyme YgiQ (UPF0313 family)
MGKQITPDQIKTAVSSLAYAGIKTTTYWVIGYPGETETDFQETLRLIKELKNDIYEADCNPFLYFFSGQVNSHEWKENSIPLYPEEAREILLIQTWVLDSEPGREEVHDRVCRFIDHCRRLGIPNPYSLNDIYKADERWKQLQENAVPSFWEFKTNNNVNENKKVKNISIALNAMQHDGNWGF